MKGYKTVIFGLLLAIAPAGLTYLAGIDWTQYVGPNVAGLIAGAIVILLRAVTTTPIGKSDNTVQFTPTGRALVLAFLCLLGALFAIRDARAADLKTKAMASPFIDTSAGGWYIGLGTSAGVAQANVGGNNLFATSLVGGSLVADGTSVDVVGGYIKNGGPLGTWWRLQASVSYQNISGGTPSGSIASRWRTTQEADIGADILQSVFSAVGNLGGLSSTFSALGSFVPPLPANVTVVGTPRQYVGFVAEEFQLQGSFGAANGQTWGFAPGVKTGWVWELPGKDGKPNGNALEVSAEVLWPTQGASFNNVFATNGAPLTIGPAVKEGTQYFASVHYLFGL